jgi:hypothetical protein
VTDALINERANRLNKYLSKIEDGTQLSPYPEKQVRHLVSLYIDLLRALRYECLKDKLAIAKANASIAEDIALYIKLDPFMERVHAAIKALLKGDVEKALDILNKIVSQQKKIVSQIQSENRSHREYDEKYSAMLEDIIRKNPDIRKDIFTKTVLNQIGKGVIVTVNKDAGEITTVDGYTHKISGLKDRYYNIKKKI